MSRFQLRVYLGNILVSWQQYLRGIPRSSSEDFAERGMLVPLGFANLAGSLGLRGKLTEED